MRFSYNWLQSFFEKKLPTPKKLATLLSLHSFEVEGIEEKEGDFVFEIDVLPNRPDCYSHLGLAREISALLGFKFKIPKATFKEVEQKTQNFVKVEVKDGCLRYTGKVILNPQIGPSPSWMQKRLSICGINPINNVVDITNYVMLEVGQPLHAFDLEKIEGGKIVIRFARRGEEILTLDEEKYLLDKNILVIADSKKPIAIAGIKGGKESAISPTTKIVFLESANFDPRVIKKGSRIIDLYTDSSKRFEHGLDLNLTKLAIERASTLLFQLTKAQIAKGVIDLIFEKPKTKIVFLDPNYTNSLLGIEILPKEQERILKSLGFETKIEKGKIKAKIPSFRKDIKLAEDLIEEIGRIYGFEKIKAEFPKITLVPPQPNLSLFWENFFKDVLKSLGFCEVINYNFISQELAQKMGFSQNSLLEISNPFSSEFQILRPSLICSLLKTFKKNEPYFKEIKIFEIGKIFKKTQKKIIEKKSFAALVSGEKFLEMKGVVDTMLSQAGITDFWFDFYKPSPEETKKSLWHLKKSAEIKIGQEEIGFLGEISEKVLLDLGISQKVTAFEIDFEKLEKLATEEKEYEIISPYPAILRDVSIIVPYETLVDEVLPIIHQPAEVEDVDLIDIFEMEDGRKSLTFRIVFRTKDRALENKEVDQIFNQIVKNLEQNPNWQVRQ